MKESGVPSGRRSTVSQPVEREDGALGPARPAPGARRVLLVNDDGIDSPGVRGLRRLLLDLGHQVTLIAPRREQSGVGCAITFLRPFHVEPVREHGEVIGWTADGTPVDCVKVGIHHLMRPRPDLVISGINRGMNAGSIVFYSGTVGAAVEGWLQGVPSLAISKRDHTTADFSAPLEVCRRLLPGILAFVGRYRRVLFNVNVPVGPVEAMRGARYTRLDLGGPEGGYEVTEEPDGRLAMQSVYLPRPAEPPGPGLPTDLAALNDGWVSVTPLSLDITAHDLLAGPLPTLGASSPSAEFHPSPS